MPKEFTAVAHIAGMTCNNCVNHVTDELSLLDGIEAIEIDLKTNGISKATIVSTQALSSDAIKDAIDEAGYELVELNV
ncbi:MAG: heavy metal-associated domain-containing protein [Actinomycetaceae bacterium]|nr:heavy metal-associated domain-containing protein [Actinomycetaceae bacterium]